MHNAALKRGLHLVLCNSVKKPNIVVESFDKIDDDAYGLIISVTYNGGYSFDDYNQAVQAMTDSSFSIEPCSLLNIETNKSKTVYRCIARVNTESKPYNEESTASFKEVTRSGNMFLDESDKLWKLEGDGENRRLIKVSRDDYHDVLESKRSRSPVISSFDTVINYNIGDYVYFFNHQVKAMDFGFTVERDNKEYVLSRSTEKLVQLRSPTQVIVAHEERDFDHNPLKHKSKMILANEFSFDSYLGYIKALYGADSPYYKALEESIRRYMNP